jgi:hypothetical protein
MGEEQTAGTIHFWESDADAWRKKWTVAASRAVYLMPRDRALRAKGVQVRHPISAVVRESTSWGWLTWEHDAPEKLLDHLLKYRSMDSEAITIHASRAVVVDPARRRPASGALLVARGRARAVRLNTGSGAQFVEFLAAVQDVMYSAHLYSDPPEPLVEASVLAHHLLWRRAGLELHRVVADDEVEHRAGDLQALRAAMPAVVGALNDLAVATGTPVRRRSSLRAHEPSRRTVDAVCVEQVLRELRELVEVTRLTSGDIRQLRGES